MATINRHERCIRFSRYWSHGLLSQTSPKSSTADSIKLSFRNISKFTAYILSETVVSKCPSKFVKTVARDGNCQTPISLAAAVVITYLLNNINYYNNYYYHFCYWPLGCLFQLSPILTTKQILAIIQTCSKSVKVLNACFKTNWSGWNSCTCIPCTMLVVLHTEL
jgi:hypothetical protein